MNCVVYMDLRPFQCAQFLGGLKLLKLGNFLLKMIPVLEGLKPLLPKANIAAVKIVVEQNARLSVKDIVSCTGISEAGSVQTILKKRWDLRKFALGGYLICSLRSKRHNALNVPGNF